MVSLVSPLGPAVMLVTGGPVRPGPAHHGELVGVRRLVGVPAGSVAATESDVGALGQAVVV